MSYLDESLTSGEVVLYRTGLHWSVLIWPLVMGAIFEIGALALFYLAWRAAAAGTPGMQMILGLACAVIGAVALVIGLIRRSSIEMAVTNRRVLMKSGILGRKTIELMLSKVESIGVEQGVGGRLAGYGRVTVRGTGGTLEVFDRIARPLEFRRQVQEQIHQPPAPQEGLAGGS